MKKILFLLILSLLSLNLQANKLSKNIKSINSNKVVNTTGNSNTHYNRNTLLNTNKHKTIMLDNVTYNTTKLIHKLSCIIWFIEKHALTDAQLAGNLESLEILESLKNDMNKNIEKLQNMTNKVTQ